VGCVHAADPYEADDVRNACMQPIDDSYGDFVGTDMWNSKNPISEDCLYLNVWTPDVDRVQDGERAAPPTALKAVMVRLSAARTMLALIFGKTLSVG